METHLYRTTGEIYWNTCSGSWPPSFVHVILLWLDVIWCIMRFCEAKDWCKQWYVRTCWVTCTVGPHSQTQQWRQILRSHRCKGSIFGFVLKSSVCRYISSYFSPLYSKEKWRQSFFSDKNPVLFSSKMNTKVITLACVLEVLAFTLLLAHRHASLGALL